MMIVCRIQRKIIRTVSCRVVYIYDSVVYIMISRHTHEQFLKLSVGSRFRFSFCVFVTGSAVYPVLA